MAAVSPALYTDKPIVLSPAKILVKILETQKFAVSIWSEQVFMSQENLL
jgi:hypothetical protein